MPDEPVNCGRCAHLWNRSQPGFGVCACAARAEQTGKIRPTVALDATCEHAQLSAKCDPDFLSNLRATRCGYWPFPSLLAPAEPQPPITESHVSQNQSPKEIKSDLFQD